MIMRNMYGVSDVMMTFSGTQNYGQNFLSPQATYNLPVSSGMYLSERGNNQATPSFGMVTNSNNQNVQRRRYDFQSVAHSQRNFQVTSSTNDSQAMQQSYYPSHPDRAPEFSLAGGSERGSYSDAYNNVDSVYHADPTERHSFCTTGEDSDLYSTKTESRGVFSTVHRDRHAYNGKVVMGSFDTNGRTFFPPGIDKFKNFDSSKHVKWNHRETLMEIDREAESYLAQVSEDHLELEDIAATLKEECQPSSLDMFLQSEIFAPTAPIAIPPKESLTQDSVDRPQYIDISNANNRGGSSQFQTEDYSLSLGLKALQSPNAYRNFEADSFPNTVPCIQGVQPPQGLSEGSAGNFPFLHSDTNGEMTFSKALPAFSDTMDLDVFLEEQNDPKDGVHYVDWRHTSIRRGHSGYVLSSPKIGRRRSLGNNKSDCKLQSDSCRKNSGRSKLKHDKLTGLKLPVVEVDKTDRDRIPRAPGDSPKENIKPLYSEVIVEETKRDGRRRRYYFENEENYQVYKLLRELSAVRTPNDVPPTTAASLFYRQLTNDTEPRIMKTVQPVPNEKGRKIVVRKDIPEEKIGKYSKVGNSPFVYMHGSPSPDGPRSASLKLVELLSTKEMNAASESLASEIVNNENVFAAETKAEHFAEE